MGFICSHGSFENSPQKYWETERNEKRHGIKIIDYLKKICLNYKEIVLGAFLLSFSMPRSNYPITNIILFETIFLILHGL